MYPAYVITGTMKYKVVLCFNRMAVTRNTSLSSTGMLGLQCLLSLPVRWDYLMQLLITVSLIYDLLSIPDMFFTL